MIYLWWGIWGAPRICGGHPQAPPPRSYTPDFIESKLNRIPHLHKFKHAESPTD